MAAIEVARINNDKTSTYNANDIPKIELSKIDNLPYYIESKLFLVLESLFLFHLLT